MEKNRDFKPIAEIYGSNSFLKVKPDMLDKGKVIFSFVTTDEEKKLIKDKSLDVFLDVSEALAFGKVCENGMLYRWTCNKVKESIEKKSQYPEASWTSSLGVSKPKGQGEERKFFISKAQKGDYLITAQKRFGTITKGNDGKVNFHPYQKDDEGYKDSVYVRIPTSEFALVELAVKLETYVSDFRMFGYIEEKPKANTSEGEQPIEDLPLPPQYATEADNEEYSYPLDDGAIREAMTEQPVPEEKKPVKATATTDSSNVKAYKVSFTTLGKFTFEGNVGYLRVARNGKEGKKMRFENNLTVGTPMEKMFFSQVSKGQGSVNFTCLAKDMPDYLLYCGNLA